jgi:hypothetical protein
LGSIEGLFGSAAALSLYLFYLDPGSGQTQGMNAAWSVFDDVDDGQKKDKPLCKRRMRYEF